MHTFDDDKDRCIETSALLSLSLSPVVFGMYLVDICSVRVYDRQRGLIRSLGSVRRRRVGSLPMCRARDMYHPSIIISMYLFLHSPLVFLSSFLHVLCSIYVRVSV